MAGFEKKDEGFICGNCGRTVEKLGYTSRDHCPVCLFSLHIDIEPGDRACTCLGLLEPIGLKLGAKKEQIVYRCQKCGEVRYNVVAADDDREKIIELSAKPY